MNNYEEALVSGHNMTRVNETTVVRAVHTRFAEDETRQKPQQGGV